MLRHASASHVRELFLRNRSGLLVRRSRPAVSCAGCGRLLDGWRCAHNCRRRRSAARLRGRPPQNIFSQRPKNRLSHRKSVSVPTRANSWLSLASRSHAPAWKCLLRRSASNADTTSHRLTFFHWTQERVGYVHHAERGNEDRKREQSRRFRHPSGSCRIGTRMINSGISFLFQMVATIVPSCRSGSCRSTSQNKKSSSGKLLTCNFPFDFIVTLFYLYQSYKPFPLTPSVRDVL